MGLDIRLAETEEEKRAVYRFRYDVYVEEMGRYRGIADHENRMLVEPEDETGRILYAADGGEVVATARSSWGGDAPFSRRQVEQYSLAPFLAELPPEAISIGERGMIAPRLRGNDLIIRMMGASLAFGNAHRVQLGFGACEPHLLTHYLGLGHRTFSKENINSPESGYLIPLVFVIEDVAYLRSIDSPLLEYVRDFGDEARVPECIARLLAEHGAVVSHRLTSSGVYWREVHGALGRIEDRRVAAFDGMREEEAVRCLGKSNIIECRAGDRVLKKGGVARNIFVVLDGTLEVRDGDRLVRVLGPGEIFGEVAFLLELPRSMDIYAATDGVRVLSLSETTIRRTIENDPEIAANLLLNVSKMLCFRLIKSS